MKSLASVLFVALVSAPVAAQPAAPAQPQPPPVTVDQAPMVLTLEKALELAQQQQPTLREAKASLEAAEGRIDAAHVANRPTVTAAASLGTGSKSQRTVIVNGTPTGATSGGFFTASLDTGLSVSASWRIYDFGQTRANIAAAEANAAAAAAGIDTTTIDIRKEVESAYLEAVARAKLIAVAQATVTSEEGHLDQAKKFVAAQAHDPIEVAQAQARAANARSALAQAKSNEAIALANLRAAIGWVDLLQSIQVDQNWPTPPNQEPPQLSELIKDARGHRPEIVQFDKQIAAAQASIDAAHAERRPVLSASASTQWNPSSDDWSPEPSWQAGLVLSWALYDAGKSRADVRVANANQQSTIAQRDALLVSLTSQLDAARSQIVANQSNVQASTEAVTAARAQLQLADARYAQGLGSQIELADAQTAVTTAEGNLVTAQWQLADAWASLRRALGQI